MVSIAGDAVEPPFAAADEDADTGEPDHPVLCSDAGPGTTIWTVLQVWRKLLWLRGTPHYKTHLYFLFSDCAEKETSPEGQDTVAARRLWEESARLVGLRDTC